MSIQILPFLSRIEQRWLFWSCFISVIVIALYVILHFCINGEAKRVRLNAEQIELARSVLKAPIIDQKGVVDTTINRDSLKKIQLEHYLNLVFELPKNNTNTSIRSASIAATLAPFSISELDRLLPSMTFLVPSIFWLSGKKTMLEVIFWSLFGLAASILYRVTEAIRDEAFNTRKIPIHIAKTIYAPLSTIVIIFSIGIWTVDRGEAFISIDYGLIIGSFILGFFSGRTVDLLKRIKDILLPLGNDDNARESRSNPVYQLRGKLSIWTNDETAPIPNWNLAAVEVSSIELPSRETQSAQIAKDGTFEFSSLIAGEYLLFAKASIDKIRYEQRQIIVVSKDSERQNLDIYLKPLYSHETNLT